MDNAVLQIRISNKLKKDSMIVAENLGFTTSTLIKLFLAHVVKKRKIPFEIEEIPNAKTSKILLQAEKEILSGDKRNSYSFDNIDKAIDFMKQYVKSHKKNKNRIKKTISPKTGASLPKHSKTSVQANLAV